MKHYLALLLHLTLGSPALFAEGPVSPVSPQDSIALIQVQGGHRVELVAAEPEVIDPVALAFDERLRLYVVEDRGYPTGPGEGQPPAGMVALLEDCNGDGLFEKRTTFAEHLTFPNGILPWRGGVLVTCAPDVLFLKDTDGDGRADLREVILSGFSEGGSTQLQVSHPTLGMDNWVYFTNGLSGGSIRSQKSSSQTSMELGTYDCRWNPETGDIERVAGQAQFGQTFDKYGRRFVCSNRKPAEHVVMPLAALARNPFFAFGETSQNIFGGEGPQKLYPISENLTTAASHAGTFTAACGLLAFQGTGLQAPFQDNLFVCDPTGNLVHNTRLDSNGASFIAVENTSQTEFLASTDNWFRPVNLANGPDGALYICDMYRKTIEHPVYLPEEIRKITDFESGKDKGRIYRVVYPGRSATQRPALQSLHQPSSEDLCRLLAHPEGWWRDTAQRLLMERMEKPAPEVLKELASDPGADPGRLHALKCLEWMGELDDSLIADALRDPAPGIREGAVELAAAHIVKTESVAAAIRGLGSDGDPRVRFECALALGQVRSPENPRVLAAIAAIGLEDRWTRAAVLTSIGTLGTEFLTALLDVADRSSPGFPLLLEPLGRILGASLSPDALLPLLNQILKPEDAQSFAWQSAFLLGILDNPQAHGAACIKGLLVRMIELSVQVALDEERDETDRVRALEILTLADEAESLPVLRSALEPSQPLELRTAAAKALAGNSDPEVIQFLMGGERWHSLPPPVRGVVISEIFAKGVHLEVLLSAIQRGAVESWAIDAARREQIKGHPRESVRQLAANVFEGQSQGSRDKVYEEYLTVLKMTADANRGREVFFSQCTQCHRLEGRGFETGPDLFGIKTQTAETILLHILAPNREIAPAYVNYAVETTEGEILTGVLASETPNSVTLRRAQGEEDTLLRSEIVGIRSTDLSLMPEELERGMSRQDLADLVFYLKGAAR